MVNRPSHDSVFLVLNGISEAKEPSFLRKLREESGGGGSLRHERPLARPKKQKAGNDDDDDPTYVDEESQNTMTKAEYESLVGRQTVPDKEGVNQELNGTEGIRPVIAEENDDDDDDDDMTTVRIKQPVAEIGAPKRRKAVKAVGDDTEHSKDAEPKTVSSESGSSQKLKTRKKVKLSFDADGDG